MGKFMCVETQCLELRQKYPYLFLKKKDDEYFVSGTIFIEKDDIKDRYEVEIQINRDYPKKVPTVRETRSKIVQTFHHYPDGILCLEAPLTVHEIFQANKTLINFIDNLLVPYLYVHSYYLKHDKLPFGEHAHGAEGILEDYKKRFEISEDSSVLRLLQILAENTYRGHYICPCGSKRKLRDCHGKNLLRLKSTEFNFMKDYLEILTWLKKTKNFDIAQFISRRVKGVIEKIKANPNQKWGY